MYSKKIIIPVILVLIVVIFLLFRPSPPKEQKNQIHRTDAASEIVGLKDAVIPSLADFPVYPGAVVEETTERKKAINSNQDLHGVWLSQDSVEKVMNWYLTELPKSGWKVQPPNDPNALGELIAQLSKGDLTGYIGIEDEEDGTEIVIDFRKDQP